MDIKNINKRKATVYAVVFGVLVISVVLFLFRDRLISMYLSPDDGAIDTRDIDISEEDVEVLAENLNIPWEIIFLPNEDILVTERPGTLRLIENNGEEISIEGVNHIGEGGLLGAAIHPDFQNNNYLYLYLTSEENGEIENIVERYTFENNNLGNREVILEGIPGARFHNGGRIKFGPDGFLYITTGDAQNLDLPQNTGSLAGKILRIDEDGGIPEDNPFGNEVWTYGHRNPQGIAWDEEGRMWSTEHGATGNDEVNRIEQGNNYGWPVIEGSETEEGMETPIIHSTMDATWAPSGMTFLNERLYFTGLRGVSLYEAEIIDENNLELESYLGDEYGRLRTVRERGGFLYILTNNTDGRGSPREGDDKIIRINPQIFE